MKSLFRKRHPQETMLLFAMIGMGLAFVFLTFSYLVRKNHIDWVDFRLPKIFGFSTVFILLSSYTLYIANNAFKKEEFFTYRYFLGATLALGVFFVISQLIGWRQLEVQGLHLRRGAVSVGFLYVISGLHILHLFGGMGAMLFLFWQAVRKTAYVDAFVYAINPPNQRRLHLATIFWHFLGILWLYLFVFFYVQH
ncbi:MAG: heme-copper oxidase subunit III [Thermonemataceae bacterium]|nr:heme-copper oxidase subunit III [Thermonemataceae bacterium]